MSLASSVLSGDRLALSRLLTHIENDTLEGREALNQLFAHTGAAHLVGVTGAPGTGKSSLVNQLARICRQSPVGVPDCRVAIVAVDPTSPFTGGAILGDRIRMRDLAGDPGVFIRSMASRGALGGLASTTSGLVQAFDAAGFELIFIETVGAGQVEVDIARLAHTTLVVDAPGLGDDVQAIKAGILEIADILVVNKADRPGAEQTERALRNMLKLASPVPRVFHHHGRLDIVPWTVDQPPSGEAGHPIPVDGGRPTWITPIHSTIAIEGEGVQGLAEEISRHKDYLERSGEWSRRERARLSAELENLLRESLVARWRASFMDEAYQSVLDRVVARRISPYQALKTLLNGKDAL